MGETLPSAANRMAQLIVELFQIQKKVMYNSHNCRRFIKRCCQIQNLFDTSKMNNIINISIIKILEEIIEEAIDFFNLFTDK